MKKEKKILIGGQALRTLGSDRHTEDYDYLINDKSNNKGFITSKEVDYLNANGNKFFAKIYKIEEGNEIASPQSLLELKVYAFVQHYQNFNFKKADSCEYDIKFLVRRFGLKKVKIVNNYITDFELTEAMKIINSVKF